VLSRFDHVTIAVLDVDASVARYTALLGAGPAWRGEHPELGSRAALFTLSNAAIELVGPRGDAPEAEGLRQLLTHQGEGLRALAFTTPDAGEASKLLRERGFRATPPQEGEARGEDGSLRSFRTVELSPKSTRGLSVFAVERPDLSFLAPAAVPPPHAVDALDHVALFTSDPDAALALYGTGFGIRLALDRTFGTVRMLFFRLAGVTLEVVHDPAAGDADRFYGVTYRVRDLEAAHARLREAGFALSEPRDGNKPGTRVFGVRDGTSGVPTLILHDPARSSR
jgi:catechol 2,3-dioxygenase-like lactoylglutathione lyase family enzyme